mmetsp:Transcript_40290/g.129961  ORF Transcript_40290/g.129961 Transcript_40290/m.129961 type:complete len:241 (-) Transcript_40290:1241-1963(-)
MCTWSWPLLHVCERKRWYSPPALERKRGGWRVERHNSWRRRLASLKRRATKKRASAKRAMTPAAGRTVVRSTLRKCSSSSSGGSSQSTPRYPPVQTHTPPISHWPWPEHWISSIFSPALRTPGCSRRSHARCSQVGCGKSIGPSDGSPPPLACRRSIGKFSTVRPLATPATTVSSTLPGWNWRTIMSSSACPSLLYVRFEKNSNSVAELRAAATSSVSSEPARSMASAREQLAAKAAAPM